MRQHWVKWFQSSLIKRFSDLCSGASIPFFAEATDDRETDGLSEYVEFRAHGPDIVVLEQDNYRVDYQINVLVATARNLKNTFRNYEIAGIIQNAMIGPIPIYKLGNGVDDDASQLTCLTLAKSLAERQGVQYRHLGRLGTATDFVNSVVSAQYRIESLRGDS